MPAAAVPPSLPSFGDIQRLYTDGGRRVASRGMTGLARTRLTPMALTIAGVGVAQSLENISDIYYGAMQRRERMEQIAFSMMGRAAFSTR